MLPRRQRGPIGGFPPERPDDGTTESTESTESRPGGQRGRGGACFSVELVGNRIGRRGRRWGAVGRTKSSYSSARGPIGEGASEARLGEDSVQDGAEVTKIYKNKS